jgi:hypothetical protein
VLLLALDASDSTWFANVWNAWSPAVADRAFSLFAFASGCAADAEADPGSAQQTAAQIATSAARVSRRPRVERMRVFMNTSPWGCVDRYTAVDARERLLSPEVNAR